METARWIRHATMDDFEAIMPVYAYARKRMAETGNPRQWGDKYPLPERIREDIAGGHTMLLVDDAAGMDQMPEDPVYPEPELDEHKGIISNYDLRLVQPNQNAIPTAGLHTIEHTIAVLLRERIPGYIDCSPFGCRTGFHLLAWGRHSTEDVAKALKESLEFIAGKATWDDVPGTEITSCGNYRDHSLFSAKQWSRDIVAAGISSDPYERKLV